MPKENLWDTLRMGVPGSNLYFLKIILTVSERVSMGAETSFGRLLIAETRSDIVAGTPLVAKNRKKETNSKYIWG